MTASRDVSAAVVGGKAAALLELRRAGFRIPETICSPEDLASAFRRLGPPVAVRSSATLEDGSRHSFAGQFESYLNLNTLDEVVEAVRRCHESVRSPSAIEYCRKNGIDPGALRMEVLLQRMIRPEIAGVAFTVNPVTGADEVVIEACEGLADGLLAGNKSALPADHPLLRRHRPEIEATARRVQRHFGTPQDIEFAVEDGHLYLLQARPVTRIAFPPDSGEWTTANFREGVSATVCTPLMASLYDFVWQEALPGYLRDLKLLKGTFPAGRSAFGRPYWNLGAVKACLEKLPGYVEREFDRDLDIVGSYEGDGVRTPRTPWRFLRALPTALAIRRIFREQEESVRRHLAGEFDAIEKQYDASSGDPDAVFRDLVGIDYRRTETLYFRTVFCTSIAKLLFKESFPDADYSALVSALPPLSHMAPLRALRAMSVRGETDVTPLLRRFRHHSRRELDLRAPRWDEDRKFVEDLLRRCGRSSGEDPRPAYQRARAEMLERLPRRRHAAFHAKLDRLRRFVWLREQMKDVSTRMYYLLRKTALEIARRRGLGDNIFFMTVREVFEDDRSGIDRNRGIYEGYRNFAAPSEIGSRHAWAGSGRGAGRPAPRGALRGIAASHGLARGVARVVRTVEEAAGIEKGAILVCPFTDPGWAPILDRAGGVVTETGGLLSHAAVICREYAIPAVLGVPGVLDRIRDGQTVLLDGGAGVVELFDPSPVDERRSTTCGATA